MQTQKLGCSHSQKPKDSLYILAQQDYYLHNGLFIYFSRNRYFVFYPAFLSSSIFALKSRLQSISIKDIARTYRGSGKKCSIHGARVKSLAR